MRRSCRSLTPNRTATSPTFEAGGDYAWLNNVQAIGMGRSDRAALHYDIYELT